MYIPASFLHLLERNYGLGRRAKKAANSVHRGYQDKCDGNSMSEPTKGGDVNPAGNSGMRMIKWFTSFGIGNPLRPRSKCAEAEQGLFRVFYVGAPHRC